MIQAKIPNLKKEQIKERITIDMGKNRLKIFLPGLFILSLVQIIVFLIDYFQIPMIQVKHFFSSPVVIVILLTIIGLTIRWAAKQYMKL